MKARVHTCRRYTLGDVLAVACGLAVLVILTIHIVRLLVIW